MKYLMALVLAAGCTSDGTETLRVEEQMLLGCWEAQSTDVVQLRFHEDHTVDSREVGGSGWHTGTFKVLGDALTLDFGEEPPTYHITITTTELVYLEKPDVVYARISCPM